MTATGAPEGRWCDLPRHYSERISKIGQGICAKMKTEIKSGCIKSSFTSASEDDIGPPWGLPGRVGRHLMHRSIFTILGGAYHIRVKQHPSIEPGLNRV
jgi:hypothetical protein